MLKALFTGRKSMLTLSMSTDGKHTAYVGPTEFVVTIVETNSLNQTLRIDISSCSLITNDRRTISSSEGALFARFAPNRQLFVATTSFKLLKFDAFTGKLLNIVRSSFVLLRSIYTRFSFCRSTAFINNHSIVLHFHPIVSI